MSESKGLKILELRASNIKRLRAVAIKPDGSIVQVTGPNGAGKSSVLDSIFMALAGTKGHPSQPIRKGQQAAEIRIDLGPIIVTRKFTKAGTTLEVARSDDGSVFKKGQGALDSILGELTFDPLAFTRLAPKQQLEQLRGLVKIDVDLDELDRIVATSYEHRTDSNRRVKTLQERVDTLAAGLDSDMDVTPIDTVPLLDAMETASSKNAAIERERNNRIANNGRIASSRERAAVLRKEAEELLAEAKAHEANADALEKELDGLEPIDIEVDIASVRRQLQDAERENAARTLQARQRSAYAEAEGQLKAAQAVSANLTASIDEANAAKTAAIAAAKMPIEGLSFGDGQVIYNGLPLEQASAAEQLRVATAIGMAMNPRLRILTIKDGSLLTESSRAALYQMVTENNFQLWLEVAEDDPEAGQGKIIIEDGSVVGAIAPESELAAAGD